MNKDILINIIEKSKNETPCDLDIFYNEPLCDHTTFKVGGPADVLLRPGGENFPRFCISLFKNARAADIPVFIIGGGANIVVSDSGIRGIVLDTSLWNGGEICGEGIIFKSGTKIDDAVNFAAEAGLSGLEFLAGMPGAVGGSVYMNARCYGKEISDILTWTEIIDFKNEPEIKRITADKNDFEYKKSPFQNKDNLIIKACFSVKNGDNKTIQNEMEKNRKDREAKGHYLFPCAGSIFKNNREFGKPIGQIIDELGLCGFQIGGAQVAPFHGNIIINTGNAAAQDIRALMNEVSEKVKNSTGFILEAEVIFAGQDR